MTQRIKHIVLVCFFAMTVLPTYAQWQTFGNTINLNEWLGATGASTIDLNIRHGGPFNINYWTNGQQWQQLDANGVSRFGNT